MSLPQERSTAEQVFYTWVAWSRSGSCLSLSLGELPQVPHERSPWTCTAGTVALMPARGLLAEDNTTLLHSTVAWRIGVIGLAAKAAALRITQYRRLQRSALSPILSSLQPSMYLLSCLYVHTIHVLAALVLVLYRNDSDPFLTKVERFMPVP